MDLEGSEAELERPTGTEEERVRIRQEESSMEVKPT
jgi:hypothetical protein